MSDEEDVEAELDRLNEGLYERLRGDVKLRPDSPLARPTGGPPARYLFGDIGGHRPTFRRLGSRVK